MTVPNNTPASTYIWLGIFALGIGLILAYGCYSELTKATKAANWIPQSGTITQSNLETGNGVHLDLVARIDSSQEEVSPSVVYGKFTTQSDYKKYHLEYTVGKKVTLFQNPDNTNEAVLTLNNDLHWLYIGCGLGVLSLMYALTLFTKAIRLPAVG